MARLGLERVERCCPSRGRAERVWLERSCDKRLRISRLRSASRSLSSFHAVLLSVAEIPPLPRLGSRSEQRESRSQPESRKSSISNPSNPRDTPFLLVHPASLVRCRNATYRNAVVPLKRYRAAWRTEVGRLHPAQAEIRREHPFITKRPCFQKNSTGSFLEPSIPYTSEALKKENVKDNLWTARTSIRQFSPFNCLFSIE